MRAKLVWVACVGCLLAAGGCEDASQFGAVRNDWRRQHDMQPLDPTWQAGESRDSDGGTYYVWYRPSTDEPGHTSKKVLVRGGRIVQEDDYYESGRWFKAERGDGRIAEILWVQREISENDIEAVWSYHGSGGDFRTIAEARARELIKAWQSAGDPVASSAGGPSSDR